MYDKKHKIDNGYTAFQRRQYVHELCCLWCIYKNTEEKWNKILGMCTGQRERDVHLLIWAVTMEDLLIYLISNAHGSESSPFLKTRSWAL